MTAVDISYWQGHPNFAQVKASGVSLVISKASDGETGRISHDSVYTANRDAARAAGLAVGAYFFNGPVDPTAAADDIFNICDYRQGDILAIDVENFAGGTHWNPEQVAAWCSRLISAHAVPAHSILVYMNTSVLSGAVWGSVSDLGVRLWVASYGTNDGTAQGSPATGPWGSYALWQCTSVATVPGISGHVDLNVFGTATAGLPSTLIEDDMSAAAEAQIAEIHAALLNGQQPHLELGTVQQVFNAVTDVQSRLLASTGGGWDAFDELIRNTRAIKAALAALPAASTGGVDLSSVMSALTALEQQGAEYQAQLLTSIKALPDATLATFGLKRA